MLGGIDPIIIFQFAKKLDKNLVGPPAPSTIARIPILSQIPTFAEEPPIPIYLSAALTGIYIDSEDKNVDIETDVETKSDGSAPDVSQKGISSIVTINLFGKKNSVGLTLLSAMVDKLFEKVTSQEYSVTYLHGAITVFRGVLHSFKINQNATNDLLNITIELSKGGKTPEPPKEGIIVKKFDGAILLD